jgi:hypothetical protein
LLQKNFLFFTLLCITSLHALPVDNLWGQDTTSSSETGVGVEILEAERQAVEWLKGQIVPNNIVPEPDPSRRRLMLSYLLPLDDPAYPYIYSRSFIYDDALGVIAMTMAGEYRRAENVLSAFARLIREDGSFWFAYNTSNNWPSEEDHEGALIRMGAIAWAGYAATFYLNAQLRMDQSYLETDFLAKDFLEMAEKIARFVLNHQIIDQSDKRNGLVTGGWATYSLKMPGNADNPVEEYSESNITWVSMEHNIDIYFFLRDLGRLTGKGEYIAAAELVREGLMRLWSNKKGQFIQGIKGDQRLDTALPLDGASWASLFLLSIGEERLARRCLATVEKYFVAQSGDSRGYKPYYAERVFEDRRVNGYFFPDEPGMRWSDLDIIWGEGSLGVASAYAMAGDTGKAREIIRSMLTLRIDGGFRYATVNVPYQFSNSPSVASTAWFVIAVQVLKDKDMRAAFWGK